MEPVNGVRPKSLSVLILLIIGNFIFSTASSIIVIVNMHSAINGAHSIVPFFSVAPVLSIFPIIASLISIFYIYIFIKTKDLSFKSYRMAITAITILAIIYSLSLFFMLLQVELPSYVSNNDSSRGIKVLIYSIFNSINLLALIIFIVFKKNKNLFINESINLKKSQKIFLLVIGLLIFFPSLSVSYSFIKESFYPDIKQLQIQGEVGHKLYMPNYLPAGIGVVSQFYISDSNSLNLSESTVRIAFDTPVTKIVIGDKPKTIVLNQALAPFNLDLFAYVKKQHPDSTPEKIEIETAMNRIAYLVIPNPKIEGGSSVKSLYLLTSENILLQFVSISQEISSEDLIEAAESVE